MTPTTGPATVALDWSIASWPNSNRRTHAAQARRTKREIRHHTRIVALAERTRRGAPVQTPAVLTLAFAFGDGRNRDLDNYDCKAFIDGLVDGGLIADDSLHHLVKVERIPDPHRVRRGAIRVTATITPTHKEQTA